MTRGIAVSLALGAVVGGCERPTCTPPDYTVSECRVQAENELARARNVDGVEVRMQDPRTGDVDGWDAAGLVAPQPDGRVRVRVAGLGGFRISVHRGDAVAPTVTLDIDNVHPLIEPLPGEIARSGLVRTVEIALTEDVVELRGALPEAVCDGGFSVAAVGDVQTGPVTFRGIVDDLHHEASIEQAAGTPLLGLVLLGDLAEFGTQDEFDRVAEILAGSPVPVAITPGNHDIFAAIQPLYNQTYGPGNHSFDVCGARFVLLDTGNGDLAPSVQAWLPALLDGPDGADRPHTLVAGMHMAPYVGYTTDGWRREDQAQHLMAELASRDADVILAGHIHWRGEFPQAPVHEVIVGTGGASQRDVDPDYGYLRTLFPPASGAGRLSWCYRPLPVPGSPGPPPGRLPVVCGPR